MYIVENYQEAEKVANLLLQDVDFVIVNGVQFHEVKSIEIIKSPDDSGEVIIVIDLDGRTAIVSYYEFESKCHFNTIYSEASSLIIGINDLTADEIKDYEELQEEIEAVEQIAIKSGIV